MRSIKRKFEYLIEESEYYLKADDLDFYGANGWELCVIVEMQSEAYGYSWRYHFKREVDV